MEPLLLHHHLAKNAGSSLRQVIRANYRPEELYENYRLSPWADGRRLWRDWYDALSLDARRRLRCVSSHSAQSLLGVVVDRPVRAFCILRDPVERVRSLYDYSMRQLSWGGRAGRPGHRDRLAQAILAHGGTLGDIFRELGGRSAAEAPIEFQLFFNGQARELLAGAESLRSAPLGAGLDGLEPHRREVLATLTRFYVVGTQDRFSQSVRLFADSFGWRRTFVPRVNVARRSGGTEIDAATRELILAHNALDAALHAHYSERLAKSPPVSRPGQWRWRTQRRVGLVSRRVRWHGPAR